MLLQLLALVVVYVVSLSHYHAGKAALITIFIGVTAFIMYFIFNMIGIMVTSIPSMFFRSLKPKSKSKNETDDLLRDLKKINRGDGDYKLPICAIVVIVLATLIFNLLKTSDFIRALYFLTIGMYAILSYLDRVFTHMGHKLIPSALESIIYFLVAISLFHA
jgi:hypothetical protein